jgi:hypothetical protein
MTEQRKVVVKDTPEAIANLEFDENITIGFSDDEDKEDIILKETLEELDAESQGFTPQDEEYKSVEDLDDDELIWDGGPTAGMIKDWKQQYGEIYVTSISYDKHIVWRVLNRIEYKQIVKKMEQMIQSGQMSQAEANMWNEETISELCILYPEYDKKTASGMMAGLPSLISQEVLEASGFVALEVRQL